MANPGTTPRERDTSYPPSAAGVDPVALPPDIDAAMGDAPTLQEVVAPRDGISPRDELYYDKAATNTFQRKDFGPFTWTLIVVAGIVLGASLAMMAAGA